MGAIGDLRKAPNFLRSESAEGLRRLIRRHQVKFKSQFKWEIMVGPDGFWYAWYQENASDRFEATGEID